MPAIVSKRILLFLLATLPLFGWGQAISQCGTDDYHLRYLELSEEAYNTWMEIQTSPSYSVDLRTVLNIPVVVHIVYRTPDQNLPESVILDQIDIVNVALNSSNRQHPGIPEQFKLLATKMQMRLCLLDELPGGKGQFRITRHSTDKLDIGDYRAQDIKYTDRGGTDAWDPSHYLNIWIGEVGNNILGYSTFPDMAGKPEDGIVLDVRYLLGRTPSYNLYRTLIHELGHYLGLCHLPGCLRAGCDVDDGMEDTPNQEQYYNARECPSWPQISCNSEDMYMNYMSLSPDNCLLMFTPDQVATARLNLHSRRSELLGRNCPDRGPVEQWWQDARIYYDHKTAALIFQSSLEAPEGWTFQLINMAGCVIHQHPISYRKRLKLNLDLPPGHYIVYFYSMKDHFYRKLTVY